MNFRPPSRTRKRQYFTIINLAAAASTPTKKNWTNRYLREAIFREGCGKFSEKRIQFSSFCANEIHSKNHRPPLMNLIITSPTVCWSGFPHYVWGKIFKSKLNEIFISLLPVVAGRFNHPSFTPRRDCNDINTLIEIYPSWFPLEIRRLASWAMIFCADISLPKGVLLMMLFLLPHEPFQTEREGRDI